MFCVNLELFVNCYTVSYSAIFIASLSKLGKFYLFRPSVYLFFFKPYFNLNFTLSFHCYCNIKFRACTSINCSNSGFCYLKTNLSTDDSRFKLANLRFCHLSHRSMMYDYVVTVKKFLTNQIWWFVSYCIPQLSQSSQTEEAKLFEEITFICGHESLRRLSKIVSHEKVLNRFSSHSIMYIPYLCVVIIVTRAHIYLACRFSRPLLGAMTVPIAS